LRNRNTSLKLTNAVLKKKASAAEQKLRLLTLRNLKRCRLLRQQKEQAISDLAAYKAKVDERLLKIFTKTQVKVILSGQKHQKWSNEDIGRALTLKYKHNSYEHLRSLGFPFPATRTLQDWTQKIRMDPGISFATLNMLKNEFQNAKELDRQCVIGFDEMSIDSKIDYDPNEDKVYGPKSNINCWFVRGLFSPWKQMIAYEFDETLSTEKFFELISHVEKCGLKVLACVNDLGGKNRGLWNKLGIKCHYSEVFGSLMLDIQSFCFNPESGSKIYMFADAPHLIKLMRNHILAKGFFFEDGTKITKNDFERLVALDNSELQANFSLTSEHLNLVGRKKQKVSFAVNLFSFKTAQAWSIAFPNRSREGDFLLRVAKWFQVFNSRYTPETISYKMPFGRDLVRQLEDLESMKQEVLEFRVGTSRTLYPFQRGILVSIESLKNLYTDVAASSMNISYILTCRLSQDYIENFFSMVRQIGGYNDNPAAVDAKRRLKIQMLAWGGKLSKVTSVQLENEEHEPFLTARMIDSLLKGSPEVTKEVVRVDLGNEEPECYRLEEPDFEEVFSNMGTDQKFEEHGKEYLCGYVAHKLKAVLPNLSATPEEVRLVQNESWVLKISAKGLTVPSLAWRNMGDELDQRFRIFHRNWSFKVNKAEGVLKGFIAALVVKCPHIPFIAIEKFIKTRFCIRLKAVNKRILDQAIEKRKTRSRIIEQAILARTARPLNPQDFERNDQTGNSRYQNLDYEENVDYQNSDEEEEGFDDIEVPEDAELPNERPITNDSESQVTIASDLSFVEYLDAESVDEC